MATAVIGGRAYTVAPFKLRELRRAAPHIDAVAALAREGRLATLEGMSAAARSMLAVLAVGIEGADADALEAETSLDELVALRATFDQVLEEAGLKRPMDAKLGETVAAPVESPTPPAP